jgi:hypothetical protein
MRSPASDNWHENKALRDKSSSCPHISAIPVTPSAGRRGIPGDVPATVVDFRQEARGCVQLAKAEKHEAVRTVLLGMALGYLRLSDRANSAEAIELRPDDVRPLHG